MSIKTVSQRWRTQQFLLLTVFVIMGSTSHAYAQALTTTIPSQGPKPLIADQPAQSDQTSKKNRWQLPDDMLTERKNVRAGLEALYKEADGIQKECLAADTAVLRAQCVRKKQVWQAKMDKMTNRMREMHRRIDTWRRQQAGLSPPEWWPPPGQPTTPPPQANTSSSSTGTTTQKDQSILLPQSSTPVPPNTY